MMTDTTVGSAPRAAVIGAGSFGTALAQVLADGGVGVHLWGRSGDVLRQIASERENRVYLPGVRLSGHLVPTDDLALAVSDKDLIIAATPSHGIRAVFAPVAGKIGQRTPVVCASKGIEAGTLATVDRMLAETLPGVPAENIMVLSGPSFAVELARRQPTAVTVAGPDEERARAVQAMLVRPYLRVYTSPDVTGVAMGGAIKNVMAIAAGMAEGLGIGHNARAALITRGLRELTRLAVARGGLPLTLSGLSGMGDLVLTCTGDLSRNRRLGLELGMGRTLEEILDGARMVAEGVRTTRSAVELADRYGVDAPICREVYAVLYEHKRPAVGLRDLMMRPPRSEHEFER